MSMFETAKPAVKVRGIHLDLKGLPPTPKRLIELLDLLATARINCVLVEWEDMYPWATYPELRCATAYSRATVDRFLRRAGELGIEVVPLVQSFGHMETVLCRKRFAHLREVPDHVGDLCPSRPESGAVVLAMVEDVLRTHEGRITHFHLGGDEAWTLGSCPTCRRAVQRRGKAALYLRHIVPLLDAVAKRGVRPILWDDMMRDWPQKALRELGARTDLMCWSYRPAPFEKLTPEILDRFARAGVRIWGASAFKGADGPIVDVCNLENRLANMAAWSRAARRREMAGLVATGWSRYSTFCAPCEGLEPSLDALVLGGVVMWNGRRSSRSEKAIDGFLSRGRAGQLAGDRFARCRAASEQLANWRGQFANHLQNLQLLPQLAGEHDRVNPSAVRRVRTQWDRYTRAGKERGREWAKSHAGLVPKLWVDRYVKSRLALVERMDPVVRGLVKGK
ncbi:MAG: family 20 glycosylhydrolase [Kiritimatiellae bacterium]|nr:family 20 glycosylhydrolase [Kiritimatiellia bacterium]